MLWAMNPIDLRAFSVGASVYDQITRQPIWAAQVASVLEHLPAPPASILDIGCGPGISSFALARSLRGRTFIEGVDLSQRMIARARHHHTTAHPDLTNIRFTVGDVTALSFPAQHFELVVGHSFLYLVPDPRAALRSLCRVLRPGGRLVLMEPHRGSSLPQALSARFGHRAPARRIDRARFVTSMLLWKGYYSIRDVPSPRSLAAWLQEAGFADVHHQPTLGGLGVHLIGARP